MSKDNNKIQSLWINMLVLRGLVENLRRNPQAIKSLNPAISKNLRLLVQIPSIHSLCSKDNLSSVYDTFNVISSFLAAANQRNGWGIILDCNIYVINKVVLFNELMDDIIAGKIDADTFLNSEFIHYFINFPKLHPTIDHKAYKKATIAMARKLIIKLCSTNEAESPAEFKQIFETCLELFKKFTEILTLTSLTLLDENRNEKLDPLNKNGFAINIIKLIVAFLVANDKLQAHTLLDELAEQLKTNLFEQGIFRRLITHEFASGKELSPSLLKKIYSYKLAFVQLAHIHAQLEKFANQHLYGYIPAQFSEPEEVLSLLDSSQLQCLALMRLHPEAAPADPALVKRITYAFQSLLLKPIRTKANVELVSKRLQQLLVSAKCAGKSQIDMRVMGLCLIAKTTGASICSDFNLTLEILAEKGYILLENSDDSAHIFYAGNITEAACFLIEKSQNVRSRAIKDLGLDINELFIVPELSELDFTHTILRRSITPMYLDSTKDTSMPSSPFKRVNSYPQDGKKLSELRI